MPDAREIFEMVTKQRPPEPGALERQHKRQVRASRNNRIGAFVVAAVIGVGAIALILANRPGQDTTAPAGPSNPPMASPADRIGLVGLAPEGMAPSLPASGELVVGFFFGHTAGDPGRFHVNVYEDGRMLWHRLGDAELGTSSTGWIEQRLTPQGVEAMRAEALATGLFEKDAHFVDNHGLYFGDIRVRDGDRFVRVTWGDVGVDAPATVPTVEQADALNRLDARFADPASWLPADAWQDPEMRPFVPSMYSACFGADFASVRLEEGLAPLPPLARDLLRAQGPTREEYTNLVGAFAYWCADVTADDARELAAALDGDHRDPGQSVFGLAYTFGDLPQVWLRIEPILPDQV